MNYSKKLLEKTRKIWEPRYSHSISDEDCREIIDNCVNLFTYLMELDKKYGKGFKGEKYEYRKI